MTKKKNGFFTFLLSLFPGAGEMYLGFYKMGASIMILFWGGIGILSYLFYPAAYLLPILWFFSFIHTNNLNRMSDEEFYALEDDYLFHLQPAQIKDWCVRHQKLVAVLLLIFGVSILWSALHQVLFHILDWFFSWSDTVMIMFDYISQLIPKLAAAALVLWLGWRLIHEKKEQLNVPPYLDDQEVIKEMKKEEP